MNLLNKYKTKIYREILKRDSETLTRLIEKYNLNLYIKDNDRILFNIETSDNIRHLITEKSNLDGSVAQIIKQISQSANESAICLDVGANFGLCSILMSRFAKKVYAFEPIDQSIERFKNLLEVNNVSNVEIIPSAVSDNDGQAKFYVSEGRSAHNSLGKAHESHSSGVNQVVDVITLDKFCSDRGVDNIFCLKIDVEGFEREVLLGAKELLRNKKIKHIIFEVSMGVMMRLKKDPIAVIELLEDYEFTIKDVEGRAVTKNSDPSSFLGQDLVASLSN